MIDPRVSLLTTQGSGRTRKKWQKRGFFIMQNRSVDFPFFATHIFLDLHLPPHALRHHIILPAPHFAFLPPIRLLLLDPDSVALHCLGQPALALHVELDVLELLLDEAVVPR